jgi:hypothetical protein
LFVGCDRSKWVGGRVVEWRLLWDPSWKYVLLGGTRHRLVYLTIARRSMVSMTIS